MTQQNLKILFQSSYHRENFISFLKEKFNFLQAKYSIPKLEKLIEEQKNKIETFEDLGEIVIAEKYPDSDRVYERKLYFFEIEVTDKVNLSRNRIGLRNIVARAINNDNDFTGAIAVITNGEDWRLSFIFYDITWDKEKNQFIKVETPPKRYTYLLGKEAKVRTITERFEAVNKKSTWQDLKNAFSVEALNKEFYNEIFNWYQGAIEKVTFPNDLNSSEDEQDEHSKNSLLRLLTRLLFVWFLKEKKLVNEDFFELEKVKQIIDYDREKNHKRENEKESTYYKAILQNLFFATLNRPIPERKFRDKNKDGNANGNNYLVTNIYRYENFFKENFLNHEDKKLTIKEKQEKIKKLFNQTPFLNGGLFDCLDREATEEEKQKYEENKTEKLPTRNEKKAIRIDGFSDNEKNNSLSVPNDLFFEDDEKKSDKNGLIDILKKYQFTVEEATPLDIDVALDPELLGKVFENLLASTNDETKEQARKATGSFYTPREIVSFMVDESLKNYLKNFFQKENVEIDEKKIDCLFEEEKDTPLKEGENTPSLRDTPLKEGNGNTSFLQDDTSLKDCNECKEESENSPSLKGWQSDSSDGVVKKWYELPYNPKLKQRAKELRKAGNLAEVLFWNQVKKKQFLKLDFDRQKIIGNYIVDFYCKDLGIVIEIDGSSHNDKVEYDKKRDNYLQGLGLIVIHFTDRDVKKNIEEVLKKLEKVINTCSVYASSLENENTPSLRDTPLKEGNELSQKEKEIITRAIDQIKILDPAVGSGAFPMGILQRMVDILGKVDPENEIYKQRQLDDAEKIEDESSRNISIKGIEEIFSKENNYNDYSRKLTLIQKCIYGVDIQNIAIQICKLRFFISLMIEQKINNDEKDNYGLKALPNLETKFVVADSLMGLEEQQEQGNLLETFSQEIKKKQKELQKNRERHFTAKTRATKNNITKKDIEIRKEIKKLLVGNAGDNITKNNAEKISSWNPYDQNNSADWFDAEWMFGVNSGFDVVIGNPPYVFTRDVNFNSSFKKYIYNEYIKNIALPNKSKSRQAGKINLFAIFLLKGKRLVKRNGNLIYIIPNNILRSTIYDVIRFEILNNSYINSIVDLGKGVFNNVTASTIILQLSDKENVRTKSKIITDIEALKKNRFDLKYINQNIFLENTSYTFNIMLNEYEIKLSSKIKQNKKKLGDICVDIIEGIVAHKYLIFDKKEKSYFDLIEGKDVKRFFIRESSNFILWDKDKIHRTRPDYLWKRNKKIIMQRISGGDMPLVAAIDLTKRKTFASTNNIILIDEYGEYYEFITCLLNSKLINWYYANNFSNKSKLTVNISKTFLEALPIQLPNKNILLKINNLYNTIITKKENNQDTTAEERQIDEMVFDIYRLSEEERRVVEGE